MKQVLYFQFHGSENNFSLHVYIKFVNLVLILYMKEHLHVHNYMKPLSSADSIKQNRKIKLYVILF